PEKTSIEGSKTWDDNDNQDGKRPESITINLLADGTKVDSKTVTEADNWSWKFENLNKYKSGKEIVYTITEDVVEGYTTTIDGFNVVNTHVPEEPPKPEKTRVPVRKIWDDGNNADGIRPASVTVKLFADGTDTGLSLVLNAQNQWRGAFEELAKTAEDGHSIVYTVEEIPVPGYTTKVDGYEITNTHRVTPPPTPETTERYGRKVWSDNNNAEGKRPASITIRLYADGVEIASKVVTAEDNWAWSFRNLEKYRNGRLIRYSFTEDPVEGYTTRTSVDADGTIVFINERIPVTPPERVETPRTGDDSHPTLWKLLFAGSGLNLAVFAWLLLKKKRRGAES
ncbi:MAG: Cna B-type domain-containing protein, partial [Oscillospiraceae bacterium]|nr:Cna B-type domain-containing protein [Oscillospiraceae bacterium]